jgi:tRNA nucleotidyltransferase (CCA-adding enzyme)
LANKTIEVSRIESAKVNAKPLLVGSLTRDTWLPDKKEFDIFILFPPDVPRKEFEKKGLEIGKKVIRKLRGKFKIEYAEHPYVCGKVRGVDIDIVPCYEIGSADELKCAVDRTPFHVKYIDKHLPLEKSGEVRLLKQFCKANGVYGADAKTEGLSGYVCELLIVKYGSFLATAKALADCNAGMIVDIEQFYDKKEFNVLRRQFKNQALILIDPIDKKRNAAAAVSSVSLYKLKKAAKQFLSKPSTKQFFKKKYKSISKAELLHEHKRRGTKLILISFKPPKVVPDILWPQLRKFADRLEAILKENEFLVLRKDVYTDEDKLAVVLLEMKISELPSVQKRIGPTVFAWANSKRFLDKYSKMALTGPFVEDNFWVVEVKRKFLTAQEKLKDSLKDREKILKAKGIPSHIAKKISKKYEMFSEPNRIMKLAKKDKDFGIFLRKYFEMESLY